MLWTSGLNRQDTFTIRLDHPIRDSKPDLESFLIRRPIRIGIGLEQLESYESTRQLYVSNNYDK